ncbi:response regulator transcription factor [Rufibacter roseus]|uniref:Response regulator transcription factor n=1 Tax=Rufibacter roseus TaxID=1567108 RepID=A0ABW2DN73_9BACT|nr:response regulator [Rufibacter roseus]
MKILIAEDEPITLATMQFRLKKDGHEVLTANNGQEALALLAEHTPQLVITDIMMPFASGLEVLTYVKKLPTPVPVIVLSAMGQENVVVEAFNLGADDYITKPFSPNELALRVRRFTLRAS